MHSISKIIFFFINNNKTNERFNLLHHARWLGIGGILGLMGFTVLPLSLKIYAFLIPLFIICRVIVHSQAKTKFNYRLFFFISILVIFIPTPLYTLDALHAREIKAVLDSPAAGTTTQTVATVMANVSNISSILLFGIPTIMIFMALYVMIFRGKIKQGIIVIVEVIVTLFLISTGIWILVEVGALPNYGIFGGITTFYDWILQTVGLISNVAEQLFQTVFGYIGLLTETTPTAGPPHPDLVEPLPTGMLDYALSGPAPFILSCSAAAPFIVSVICFILCFHALLSKDYQEVIDSRKLTVEDPAEDKKGTDIMFTFRENINWSVLVFFAIVVVIGTGMYISLSDPGHDLTMFGFYFVIQLLCVIVLMQNLLPYNQGASSKFFEGWLYGTLGIFVFFQILVPHPLDLLLDMNGTNVSTNILTQWILVAPTESLFFHIFLPGLIMVYLLVKYRQDTFQTKEGQLYYKKDLNVLRADLYITALKEKNEAKRTNLMNDIAQIDYYLTKKDTPLNLTEFIYSSPRYTIYFYFSILLPNIIFALYHNFHSGRDFITFFGSGVGLVYLSAGIWITAIGWHFDWRAAILSHATSNTIVLLLSGAFL